MTDPTIRNVAGICRLGEKKTRRTGMAPCIAGEREDVLFPLLDRFGRKRAAFSLVEVVLAIGVTAVALIGIFALLQSALGNYRDAMNSTIASSINQQVLSQYLLADFSKISSLPSQTGYYDERGLPLPSSDSVNAVYISISRIIPHPITNVDDQNLLAVHISITSPTQREFQKTLTSIIARQGKDLP